MAYPNILALTSDGTPHQWLSWEVAVTMKYKNLLAWEIGDDDLSFNGGVSRMTGERSHIEVKNIVALKGKFKFNNKAPALTNSNLFARDLYTCGYCGRHFQEDKLTRDHIVPVSKGGKDVWTNVIAACKKCNNAKDSHMLEDTDLQLIWVPYAPVRVEQLIMQNRKILFDQAKFILDFCPKHSRMHQFVERKFMFD